MIVDRGVVAGNVTNKYNLRNPVARLLMRRFLAAVTDLYASTGARRVLEVGCGEGELCRVLSGVRSAQFVGIDISPAILGVARQRHPELSFAAQSADALGFDDNAFDLVIACEVLEHLPDPEAALREMERVSRRHLIFSVPREPIWRALNVARGAYLRDLGNTPGHLQHWSRSGFVRFVGQRLDVRRVMSPVPWTMVAAEVATGGSG